MKIDWNDFEKMAQDKGFLSSVDREVGELIEAVQNIQQTFKHLTYDAQLLIADEIERYKRKNPEKDTNGLSGTFRGEKAVQFAQLIINLKNTKDNLQNTVMPLIEHLGIKTLDPDFDCFDVSVDNINYFLDNLEISYTDLRFDEAKSDEASCDLCNEVFSKSDGFPISFNLAKGGALNALCCSDDCRVQFNANFWDAINAKNSE